MAKKILFVLRILVLVIFCGLVLYFYFTDNYGGATITAVSFMFISLLLSVLKDNMTKSEDGSEGNTKNKPLSRKQKISDIILITIFIILALFSLLCQFLNFDVDYPYVVIFIIPVIVILAIVSEIINYKRNR